LLSKTERPRYQERSIHQPINRSLAFSLPPKVSAGAIVNTMKDAGPSWLDAVDIVDLFEHEADGIAMRAVTFSLRYSNDSGDRSAEAVNQSAEALIATVLAQFGERGVSLRA
jgi:phenylalanyl-tRNA synthetase beta subunit